MCFRALKWHCSRSESPVRHLMVRMFAHFLACFAAVFFVCWFG